LTVEDGAAISAQVVAIEARTTRPVADFRPLTSQPNGTEPPSAHEAARMLRWSCGNAGGAVG
jgi:hypothetical protein